MRALWRGKPHEGPYYRAEGGDELASARPGGPPVWIGSWGSPAGLRRVARIADGWIASGYKTTPTRFAADWQALQGRLSALERDSSRFRNALATCWTYVTEDPADADRVLERVLAPAIGRTSDELRDRVLIGSPEQCAAWLDTYVRAGVQLAFLWPVVEPERQLALIRERVAPALEASGDTPTEPGLAPGSS